MEITFGQGAEAFEDAAAVRTRVFMEEQGFKNEFGPEDEASEMIHVTLYGDGVLLGCARVFPATLEPMLEDAPGRWVFGRLAVLPIGYADGFHRVLSNESGVWLDGECRQIIGRVCMDMCMVGLPASSPVKRGAVAEVFGPRLPIERHAKTAGTISYELLCAVAPRVPRIYLDA